MRIRTDLVSDVFDVPSPITQTPHVVWIIVDRGTSDDDRPSLLEQLAEEPESGFTKVSDGVYFQRYQ